MKKRLPYIISILYAFAIGYSPIVLKQISNGVAPIVLLAHRFLIAILFMSLFLTKRKLNWKNLVKLMPLSLFFPISMFSFQILALQYGTTLQLAIIQACLPILSLMGSMWFWKEKVTLNQIVFVLLSVIGVVVILVSGNQIQISLGLLFGLIMIISWSIYSVWIKKFLQTIDSLEISYFVMLNATIIFLCCAASNPQFVALLQNTRYLIGVTYLAIFATAFSIWAMSFMVKQIGIFQSSVFTNLATIITMFLGIIILNESVTVFYIIGAILVLIGVVGSNRR